MNLGWLNCQINIQERCVRPQSLQSSTFHVVALGAFGGCNLKAPFRQRDTRLWLPTVWLSTLACSTEIAATYTYRIEWDPPLYWTDCRNSRIVCREICESLFRPVHQSENNFPLFLYWRWVVRIILPFRIVFLTGSMQSLSKGSNPQLKAAGEGWSGNGLPMSKEPGTPLASVQIWGPSDACPNGVVRQAHAHTAESAVNLPKTCPMRNIM